MIGYGLGPWGASWGLWARNRPVVGATEGNAMKLACQIVLLAWLIFQTLWGMRRGIHGGKAQKPLGFAGAIGALMAALLITLVLWGAGTFSQILG